MYFWSDFINCSGIRFLFSYFPFLFNLQWDDNIIMDYIIKTEIKKSKTGGYNRIEPIS